MKRHEIRQNRIMELTNMALRGKKMVDLVFRCNQWKVSPSTANSYITEVQERLKKCHG